MADFLIKNIFAVSLLSHESIQIKSWFGAIADPTIGFNCTRKILANESLYESVEFLISFVVTPEIPADVRQRLLTLQSFSTSHIGRQLKKKSMLGKLYAFYLQKGRFPPRVDHLSAFINELKLVYLRLEFARLRGSLLSISWLQEDSLFWGLAVYVFHR